MNQLDCEYVADEVDLSVPGTYDITGVDDAIDRVLDYLRERLQAVNERYPQRNVMMLSGGIDSILIAAVAASLPDSDLLALTFAGPGTDPATDPEVGRARAVAAHLGLEHHVVVPDDTAGLVAEVVRRLDSTEPWEVLAGVALLALDRAAADRGVTGAFLSGAGADALFLGGLPAPPDLTAWDTQLRAKVAASFTRERFIPDFYARLLDDPHRHLQIWQTHDAYRLALRLHPDVIRGPGWTVDKDLFRRAAQRLGVPPELLRADKNPMQVSSGGIAALVGQARAQLHRDYRGKTYSDPLTEPLEFIVARLWLREVAARER